MTVYEDRADRRWHAIAVTALIIQPLIFYRRHLFSLTAHIPFDILGFHLPLAAFIERSVRQGVGLSGILLNIAVYRSTPTFKRSFSILQLGWRFLLTD